MNYGEMVRKFAAELLPLYRRAFGGSCGGQAVTLREIAGIVDSWVEVGRSITAAEREGLIRAIAILVASVSESAQMTESKP